VDWRWWQVTRQKSREERGDADDLNNAGLGAPDGVRKTVVICLTLRGFDYTPAVLSAVNSRNLGYWVSWQAKFEPIQSEPTMA
jgi:hypothetical protein